MDKCKDIIIEDRGIIIGIMFYLLKHNNRMMGNTVIIADKRIRHIIRYLFYDLTIRKEGDGFHFNIRNNTYSDIVINNINNLNDINTHHIYILPWGNPDNPVIMYRVTGKVIGRDKYKQIIGTHYSKFTSCKSVNYDAVLDNIIIQLYCKMYFNTDPVYVSNLIHCYLHNYIDCSGGKTIVTPIYLPQQVFVDRYVPYPVSVPCPKCPKVVDCKCAEKNVPCPKCPKVEKCKCTDKNVPCPTVEDCKCIDESMVNGLVDALTGKIRVINEIIVKKNMGV